MDRRRAARAVFRLRDAAPEVAAGRRWSWRASVGAATALILERPGLIAVALAGFLARGGLLLFILPVVVLPTTVGISNWIGATSITASGPTESLVWLLAVIAAVALTAFLLGLVIGAAADVVLFDAARERVAWRNGGFAPGAPKRDVSLILRLITIRALTLVPVALAIAWAANRVVAVTYHELILPEELVTPLVLRVIIESRDALAVVALAWLASETLGGLAVRHHLHDGDSTVVALLRPIGDVLLRPVTTGATFGLGIVVAVVAIAPPLTVAWLAWGRLRVALAVGDPVPLAFGTFAFVALWLTALVGAGAVAAWRHVLWSFDVLRVRPAIAPVAPDLALPSAALEPVGGRPAA